MKPSVSRLILALLIAAAVFAAVRIRDLSGGPDPAAKTGNEGGPAAAASPVASPNPGGGTRAPGAQGESRASKQDSTGGTRRPATERSPVELFAELSRQGAWKLSRGRDGRPTGLRGTPIAGATASAEASLGFARALSRELGVSPEQLSQDHSQAETDRGLQTIHKYEQWVGGYEVFGASLTVISRREDSAAYLVNSTLKPVDQAPGPGSLDRAAAEALVLAQYRDRGGRIANPVVTTAFIYADQLPAEFAWLFYVQVSSPTVTKLKVLFGASTQRVLYEAPAILN